MRAPSVVITGAGRGIGRATAAAFAAEGWRVVVAEKRRALGRAAARALRRRGAGALFVPTNVADPRSVERMVRAALARFGGIDCLVNNAGVRRVDLHGHGVGIGGVQQRPRRIGRDTVLPLGGLVISSQPPSCDVQIFVQ